MTYFFSVIFSNFDKTCVFAKNFISKQEKFLKRVGTEFDELNKFME